MPINFGPSPAIARAFRFSWYDTKGKTDVNQAEVASVGDNLFETRFMLSARCSF